jgi:hypothetical protein
VQASANMPVAPAATVTTATQRKAMIEAAKAPSAAPGSLRDSLLQTLPAQARQSGR